MNIYPYLFVIMVFISPAEFQYIPPDAYVPLIMKVREYFQASTVCLAHRGDLYGDYGDIRIGHLMHTWTRILGREGIVSLDIHFRRFYRVVRYIGNSVRPIFVTTLSSERSFLEFSNATRTFRMSFPAWLVIFLESPKPHNHDHCHNPIGNPFHLGFDSEMFVWCHNDTVVREWYSISTKNTIISDIATWSATDSNNFTLLTNKFLYQRRSNLQGMVLRAVYVKTSTFFSMEDQKFKGYLGNIVTELTKAVNITLDLIETNSYGVLRNNTWTGAIGLVMSGKADIGISDFSMTASRLQVVDFMLPLIVSRNHIYVKQPDSYTVQWSAYFKTFSLFTWCTILLVILITTIVVLFINKYSGEEINFKSASDALFAVFSMFCLQSAPVFPESSPLRLVYLTTFMVATVISAAYSAALICFLTASTPSLPFRTFDEFIADGTYRLLVVRCTSSYDLFMLSEDPVSRKIAALMLPESILPNSFPEALKVICANPKLVVFATEQIIKTLAFQIPCKLSDFAAGRVDSMSMIVPKGSPYTSLLKHNLLKFQYNGILNRFKGGEHKLYTQHSINVNPVEMTNVAPVLTILGCSIVLGILALIIEKLHYRFSSSKP